MHGRILVLIGAVMAGQWAAFGQVDPERRELIQLGYNQPIEGRAPVSGYAFYYDNYPHYLRTNITLRLAIAPVYLDSEVAFKDALGRNTDLGIGLAGGGFADSYFEMRRGKYVREESFLGHGAEVSASVYHLFDPGRLIPLSGVFRVTPHYSFYETDSGTSSSFALPHDHGSVHLRTGLRFGGVEPIIDPSVAMELSVWYDSQMRATSDNYGFNGDRKAEQVSHLFWTRALFIYTFKESGQNVSASLTAGGSAQSDRFNSYRLGGELPLSSEFPLILPGYYYQEISASRFVAFTGQYTVPLDAAQRWTISGIGTAASVDYISGLDQSGHFHSGVGAGLGYRSRSGMWTVRTFYGYGFQALRSEHRGAQSVGFLCQINLARSSGEALLDQSSPAKSRGLFNLFKPGFF